jgi:hypothetical protein
MNRAICFTPHPCRAETVAVDDDAVVVAKLFAKRVATMCWSACSLRHRADQHAAVLASRLMCVPSGFPHAWRERQAPSRHDSLDEPGDLLCQ